MAVTITVEDLQVFEPDLDRKKAEILIKDGLALAARIAPCINDEDFQFAGAAEAIIRSAILRWSESGGGGVTQEQQTVGPFSLNNTFSPNARRSLFYPSEITELQKLCKANAGGAFAIDTAFIPADVRHAPECSVSMSSLVNGHPVRCTCGAVDNAGKGPLR